LPAHCLNLLGIRLIEKVKANKNKRNKNKTRYRISIHRIFT